MKVYRNLDRNCYQMDFCINNSGECFYEREILSYGGKIYRIPTKSENFHEYKKRLSAIVSENHYRYVLRTASNAAGVLDLKIAKKAGAQICAARSSNSSNGTGLYQKISHEMGRLLYSKYMDVKIAPSDFAADYAFGKCSVERGEVCFLRNALDLSVYHYNEIKRKEIRLKYGCADDDLIIGNIGRFSYQKNHSFLVKVFFEVLKTRDHAKLMLVGDGELEEKTKTELTDLGIINHVIFTGIQKDIPSILSAMDVLVMPSLYEGMPNAVIEAQAVGVPCLIADTITKEANITGLVHYLSLSEAPDVWAKKIIEFEGVMIDRELLRFRMKKAGYDISDCTKHFVDICMGSK